ncbi:MAG: transposase [Bacteroidales bacterium]|nr:transposase [Bacteroidales bacterium]
MRRQTIIYLYKRRKNHIMATTAFKYKVYNVGRCKRKKLDGLLYLAAEIYNHAVALKRRYWRLYKRNPKKSEMQAHIAKMKRRCYPEWGKMDSQATQQIVDRIYNGYDLFFKRVAKRPPKFKNRHKYSSITFKQTGWALNGNTFTIRKLGLRIPFHRSRAIEGHIQTVTLKRDAVGDWWLFFTVRRETDSHKEAKPTTGKTAGFDFGMRRFLTCDDGTTIEAPRYLKESMSEVRRLSRNLSRKKRGSNNYRKARKEKARLERRIANKRRDFQWKLARDLAESYDTICLETLSLEAMRRRWGRKISDLAFGEFVSILAHACAKHGTRLVFVDRWEPTTKRCSSCGHVMGEMPLKVREWTCPECGARHDRDVSAAINIKTVGASTVAGGAVRRAQAPAAPSTAESHIL